MDVKGWMWNIVDYVELGVFDSWYILRGDQVYTFGDDFPKSDPEELRIMEAFTERMFHCLYETTSLTVRIVSHS